MPTGQPAPRDASGDTPVFLREEGEDANADTGSVESAKPPASRAIRLSPPTPEEAAAAALGTDPHDAVHAASGSPAVEHGSPWRGAREDEPGREKSRLSTTDGDVARNRASAPFLSPPSSPRPADNSESASVDRPAAAPGSPSSARAAENEGPMQPGLSSQAGSADEGVRAAMNGDEGEGGTAEQQRHECLEPLQAADPPSGSGPASSSSSPSQARGDAAASPACGADHSHLSPPAPPAPSAPSAAKPARLRKKPTRKSGKRFTVGTSSTFFFERDRQKDIGVGTVGLYASRAVPVVSETYPPPRAGERGESGGETSAEETAGRTFFTSTFYGVPTLGVLDAWAARERGHAEWRAERLSRSLYGNFAQSSNSPRDLPRAAAADPFAYEDATRKARPPPMVLGGGDHPPDTEAFEQERLRAIATARESKEAARARELEARSRDLLDRRHRSRYGEAVDLPTAYYARVQEVFPDKASPSQISPADHHKACLAQRQQQRQARELSEAHRQLEAQQMREGIALDLRQSQQELREHREKMLEGLPHLTRQLANDKRDARESRHHEDAKLKRAEREATRRLFAELEQDARATETERQRDLQRKVGRVVARTGGAGVRDGTRARTFVVAAPERRRSPAHAASAFSRSSSTSSCTPAPAPADLDGAPVPTLVPAVFQPSSTNFFAEVKAWQTHFQSPNTVPPTGADSAVRKAWLRRLDEERLAFHRETVAREREEEPARLSAAKDTQARRVQQQAEEERLQKLSLKAQQTSAEGLRAVYAQRMHGAQRGQQDRVRAVRAAHAQDRRQQHDMHRAEARQAEAAAAAQLVEQQQLLHEIVAASRE